MQKHNALLLDILRGSINIPRELLSSRALFCFLISTTKINLILYIYNLSKIREGYENTSGQTVQNFRKSLNYKECGLFDTIEVKVIDGTNKNVFFKSFNPDRINLDTLKKLIDELYLIHGNDGDNKGKFNSKDKTDFFDTEFYMLFGRNWTDYPKYKYPVSVSRDEDEVSISIWGIDK